MAGFVTWLRRQKDREDSVGTLSRDVIRDDPERDVWTLEGLREQMIASGAHPSRYGALAEAAVEWGASVGVSIQTRTDGVHNILAPQRSVTAASGTNEAVNSARPEFPRAAQAGGGRVASPQSLETGRSAGRASQWTGVDLMPGVSPPDFT